MLVLIGKSLKLSQLFGLYENLFDKIIATTKIGLEAEQSTYVVVSNFSQKLKKTKDSQNEKTRYFKIDNTCTQVKHDYYTILSTLKCFSNIRKLK